MRLIYFSVLFSVLFTSTVAHAGLLTLTVNALIAVLTTIGVSLPVASTIGLTAFTALPTIGSTLLAIGINFALNALFGAGDTGASQSDTQTNFQMETPPRFWIAGPARTGGNVQLGEVRNGVLYKLIAHADSYLNTHLGFYLNDVRVDVNEDHTIDNEDYLNYEIYHREGTVDQEAMPVLVENVEEWTVNHRGRGIADTLLLLRPVKPKFRANFLRFRGALGLGEPDISRAGYWGKYYDPRDPSQSVHDESTWSNNRGNSALLWAAHRIHPERYNNEPDSIDWEALKIEADICDQDITDSAGAVVKRYLTGIIVNKDEERYSESERRILASCDGTLYTTSRGKLSIYVGRYMEPDIVLTDDDIYDVESSESENAESTYTHYSAKYTEPAYGYKGTESAQFVSPNYKKNDPISLDTISLYCSMSHNQTMRLLKAGVLRQLSKKRIALTCNVKGVVAKTRRTIRIDSANEFLSGVYEIASVSDMNDGAACMLVLIGTGPGTHDLLEGEEGLRPNLDIEINDDENDLVNMPEADVTISTVYSTSSAGVSFRAEFPVPDRADVLVEFEYRENGAFIWLPMTSVTELGYAVTDGVTPARYYNFRWRLVTLSGTVSLWTEYSTNVLSQIDTVPPGQVVNPFVAAVSTDVSVSYTAPSSANYAGSYIFRHTGVTADYAQAVEIFAETSGPDTAVAHADVAPGAGTHHYWIVTRNSSLVRGAPSGPFTVTI